MHPPLLQLQGVQGTQRRQGVNFYLMRTNPHVHAHPPPHEHSTLLQLRTGCEECGHQASLHRKLTSIDRYIQDEVKKAKKATQCRHLILTREIPRSPLFEPYDLIPLPDEDQCTSENHASY